MEPLTRQETLTTLAGLGVELPPATKMPVDALQKRLKQALICAQSVSHTLKSPPLDPPTLPEWSSPRSVYDGVRRGNFQEATEIEFCEKYLEDFLTCVSYIAPRSAFLTRVINTF